MREAALKEKSMRFQSELLAQAAENERVREEIRQKELEEIRRRKVNFAEMAFSIIDLRNFPDRRRREPAPHGAAA